MSRRKKEICPATGLLWNIEYRSRLLWQREGTAASFDISLHNPRCAGDFLRCQLRWARNLFETFEISLGDTLQRHNYVSLGHPAHGVLDEGTALQVAREEGDRWIAANQQVLDDELGQPGCEIRRWETWRRHTQLTTRVAEYTELIRGTPHLAKALRDEVTKAARRRSGRAELSTESLLRAEMFAIEEIAVYHIHSEGRRIFHIYAGSPMKIIKEVQMHPQTPSVFRGHEYIYLNIRRRP